MEDTFDWQSAIREWCHGRRTIKPHLVESIVEYFQLAFENTSCPDRAWFGLHRESIGLVVGNIYLASVHATNSGHAFWLLQSNVPPQIPGLTHRPVKSSRDRSRPLIWATSSSHEVLPELVKCEQVWTALREASGRVQVASRSAGNRDDHNTGRGNRRLSEFWTSIPHNVFPDEMPMSEPLVEGATSRTVVTIYERSRKARNECIRAHGTTCCVCDVSLDIIYGPIASKVIHVHHVRPLSARGGEHAVDPVNDLRPVCPNCHTVIHLEGEVRGLEEVRELVAQQRRSHVEHLIRLQQA